MVSMDSSSDTQNLQAAGSAPIGAGSPPRATRKRGGQSASPAAPVATVAAVSPSVAKLNALDISQIDKAILDSVSEAQNKLDLTKGAKALEHVADKTTLMARGLRDAVLGQDALLARAVQRIETLEKRVSESDEALRLTATTAEQNRASISERLKGMMVEANLWETKLDEKTKKQMEDINGKLKQTADTFVQCDKVLAELKAARADPGASLSGASFAIPVAAGPASDSVHMRQTQEQFDLLRQRMDTMQATVNSLVATPPLQSELQTMCDSQVAMQLNLQESATRVDALAAWAHAQNVKLELGVIAYKDLINAQVTASVTGMQQSIETHACRCPKSGSGAVATAATAAACCPGPAMGAAAAPGCDPYCALQANAAWLGEGSTSQQPGNGRQPLIQPQGDGGGGGGRPGGGGGGGGGPGQGPQGYDIGSEQPDDYYGSHDHRGNPKPVTKWTKSPFESKAAKDELPRYNGREKQAMWRKKVTNYLHGRCCDMRTLLAYAEQCREPVTEQSLAAAQLSGECGRTFSDPAALGYHLCSWLGINLVDDAWDILDTVEDDQGFEVWRRVNQDITQRTQSEILALEHAVLNPRQVSELAKVPQALVSWDAAHRDYREAGGGTLSPERQVGAILKILPNFVHDKALWDQNFKDKPGELRAWLKEKARLFSGTNYAQVYKRGVNLLESEDLAQLPTDELRAGRG